MAGVGSASPKVNRAQVASSSYSGPTQNIDTLSIALVSLAVALSMSTRTKGFFEQDARKRPGQWSRRGPPKTMATAANAPAPPKPAIPANTQARTKLGAFQFDPTDVNHTDLDAGHEQSNREEEKTDGSGETVQDDLLVIPLAAKTFPCTPGARLPLEDLVGDCDNANAQNASEPSPEERLGWVPNSSTKSRIRKRKRAKSSSPTCPASSSQPHPHAALLPGDAPSTKKTATGDPVTDLWHRYANAKRTGDTPKLPELSSLMFRGSPRPLETPVKGGGLRRWASTGNDWPTTRPKRRCTSTRQPVNVWQEEPDQDSAHKGRVATMVEKLQQTMATHKLDQDEKTKGDLDTTHPPSSSSPLPELDADMPNPAAVSPLQPRHPNIKSPTKPQSDAAEMKPSSQNFDLRREFRGDLSRQRGDSLNPSTTGVLHLHSKAPLPAYKRPAITRQPSLPTVQPRPPPVPSKDVDDFGDDAFDLTADDLDELLSQKPLAQRSLYEIPPHPNPPPDPRRLAGQPPQAPAETIKLDDDDDDEFGCDDFDEDSIARADFCATQATISPRKRSPRKRARPFDSQTKKLPPSMSTAAPRLRRFVVRQVVDGEYTSDRGRHSSEKVLFAEDERTSQATAITLRGSWTNTSVCKSDVIHIVHVPGNQNALKAAITPPGQIMIDDDDLSPFLVVHPDHMLSATSVADSFDCVRKAVLQDRVKATGEASKAMVYGKILHEIFQQALSANQWDDHFLAELVDRTIQAHVEGLWELGMRDTGLATEEIRAKMGELSSWAHVFIAENPSETSLVDDRQGEKVWMSISKLIAIEEHVWSPQFGLKGNIDATVETTMIDNPALAPKKFVVPFEVKTGRTTQSPAHRAQTALYTLLLSDRYDVAVEAGILYYLESSSMSRIAPPLMEVRQMVQQRNRLAAYIFKARNPPQAQKDDEMAVFDARPPESQEVEHSGLPAVLKNAYKCGRCYAQASCFTYHALVEGGTAESAGMVDDQKKNHSQTWEAAVGHLLSANQEIQRVGTLKRWFAKWDKLLTFEESDQSRFRKELWTTSSMEREALGRCFGRLVLTKDLTESATTLTTQTLDGIEGSGGKINRFAYVFKRAVHAPGASFTEGSQLTIGEPVVVSSEQGQWALANGYVVNVTRREITVAVDRKLGSSRERMAGFEPESNQAFRGVMTVGAEDKDAMAVDQPPLFYRLDKDEFANGLALIRNNLVTLMSTHPIHTKLREQIILDVSPTFTTASIATSTDPNSTFLGDMNEDQQAAVSKVLSCQEYALILGMPGTGKTTTIAHIIRALLAEDKSILLTSFTHTAVDNILLKIRDIAPANSILRLGVPAKINNQVQQFCQLAATPRRTIEEVEQSYMETKIVATTCMGTNHPLFSRRTFDVCIVDEASQITLLTVLGPLLKSRRFVLVGDHFQLPPLVQNKAALEGGLDMSLFRQLSEEQPQSVAALGKQYRMCEEIMTLSNELIYSGQLRCGNEAVAQRCLKVDDAFALGRFHRPLSDSQADCTDDSSCWLAQATQPARKVVFANTDACGKAGMETLTSGRNITNLLEATLSAQLVLALIAMGVPAREIGVISLYRSQLTLMRQIYKRAGISSEVEVDSADRYQGRDKECTILSMVRSNEAGIVGDLLKDYRRVNVALTRAKSKLIVLGSRKTLRQNGLLEKFLNLVGDRKWSIDLPRAADEIHAFDFSTQITQSLVALEDIAASPQRKATSSQKKRSPTKRSPMKQYQLSQTGRSSQRAPLQESQSAANRIPKAGHDKVTGKSPFKSSQGTNGAKKSSPKRIMGKGSRLAEKLRIAREQVAMEIFEDLTGEEF